MCHTVQLKSKKNKQKENNQAHLMQRGLSGKVSTSRRRWVMGISRSTLEHIHVFRWKTGGAGGVDHRS